MSKIHVVNIGNRSCSCRRWDLTGIPCNHAVSCIAWMKDDPDKYVRDYFKSDANLKTYANFIEPLTGKDTWPNVDVSRCLPPYVKKMLGRLKKVRRREMNEDDSQASRYSRHGTTITCHLCFNEGHNRQRCPLRGVSSIAPVEEDTSRSKSRASTSTSRGRGRGRASTSSIERSRGRASNSARDDPSSSRVVVSGLEL
ncbi:transcription factor interactor and regulator CCHC(Zn) family [Canna indica]|uniref:Transcription factor interactor and regulator CCHC(Zn) family n=1 Tax=Canna indica TaxID=4628 RepID=A0AAQ3KBT9_9LILI|nr:transcription factor interactor and regulator CCHC(Zn) family [Canna indica]